MFVSISVSVVLASPVGFGVFLFRGFFFCLFSCWAKSWLHVLCFFCKEKLPPACCKVAFIVLLFSF
jgi:hypothetical protein